MIKAMLMAGVLFAASGCSSPAVDKYKDFSPTLVPESFFDGHLSAHGVVKNRAGTVIRTFNADIQASWVDGVGTLVEDFIFDDGEEQQRIWTLTPSGEDAYTGTAGDVVGPAALATAGNSLFINYVLRIPYGGSTIDVSVDDRMYLVSDTVLINESVMRKLGLRVGSIHLVILRNDPPL